MPEINRATNLSCASSLIKFSVGNIMPGLEFIGKASLFIIYMSSSHQSYAFSIKKKISYLIFDFY